MNIREFKEGDVITRNKPMPYGFNDTKDGSYLGDRMILKGHDEVSKIIFLEHPDGVISGLHDLSYARDRWDEGWCLYPETLYQKIKNAITS